MDRQLVRRFAKAFTAAERAQLAVLHLFRDTAHADVLCYMGEAAYVGEDFVPELAWLFREDWIGLLDRAARIGLLTSLGGGYYQIHPALQQYFTTLYTTTYGPPSAPAARRATRAYTKAIGDFGHYYLEQAQAGHAARVIPLLGAEEANLRHALDLARADGLWPAVADCLQGLQLLYERTGRDGEWARIVASIAPTSGDGEGGGLGAGGGGGGELPRGENA